MHPAVIHFIEAGDSWIKTLAFFINLATFSVHAAIRLREHRRWQARGVGSGFHAFIPAPVPRELPLPPRLARALGDTRAKLGRLNEGVRALPSPELFLRSFQKREAVLSSRIEGTVTTLDEAFLSAAVEADEELVDDDREVSNYERALRTGVDALAQGRALNVPLLQALHQELLRGVRGEDKQPGTIRMRQAFVANRTVQVPDGHHSGVKERVTP